MKKFTKLFSKSKPPQFKKEKKVDKFHSYILKTKHYLKIYFNPKFISVLCIKV